VGNALVVGTVAGWALAMADNSSSCPGIKPEVRSYAEQSRENSAWTILVSYATRTDFGESGPNLPDTWSQSYDRESQRQRCNNFQRQE
jgi:hypothetical protein